MSVILAGDVCGTGKDVILVSRVGNVCGVKNNVCLSDNFGDYNYNCKLMDKNNGSCYFDKLMLVVN